MTVRLFQVWVYFLNPQKINTTALEVTEILKLSDYCEPPHDKTNEITCAPSEDSDLPGHPPSLIRVFAVRSMSNWGPNVSSCGQRRLIRLGGCPRWSESLLGAQAILLILSWGGYFEVCYVCVFWFNVVFKIFLVISRRCLNATGSSTLTSIVLLTWSIMPQTHDMIPHPVTLSWHWIDPRYVWVSSEEQLVPF